jgi:hypothetical protein
MNISELTSDLRAKCEEVFYMLSADLDREVAEQLSKSVVKSNLDVELKIYQNLLLCCDAGFAAAKKADYNNGGILTFNTEYGDGIRAAVSIRKQTYLNSIDDIKNKLQILNLL